MAPCSFIPSGLNSCGITLSVPRPPSHTALSGSQCTSFLQAWARVHGRWWTTAYTTHTYRADAGPAPGTNSPPHEDAMRRDAT